jgi:hypothetical protein
MLRDVVGKWQLHQNPVDRSITIELGDMLQQFELGDGVRKLI